MRQDIMPELDEILGGRQLSIEKANEMEFCETPYFFFCNTILECVAGKKTWKVQKKKKKISRSCVTVSDEAFALLLLVNSWEKFEYMAENPQCDTKAMLPATKFTEKKGRNKKMQGWCHSGIATFNQLCGKVVEDRNSVKGKEFEVNFLQYHKDELVRMKAGNVGKGSNEDGEEEGQGTVRQPIRAYNQLQEMLEDDESDDDEGNQVGDSEIV